MQRYGQTLTWGTLSAPQLFAGICTGYSYNLAKQEQLFDDMIGSNVALALHSLTAAVSFEAAVTSGSTNFLDLSSGAGGVALSGVEPTFFLASRAVERWRLGQRKTAMVSGQHFPDMVQASPVLAGVTLDAFQPSQSALTIVTPGNVLIYGTFGMTHASGIMHALEITQELTIIPDEPSPAGTILGAATTGYLRRIVMEVLATGSKPAVDSTLAITTGPSHAANHRINSVDEIYADKRGKMYRVGAVWIPPFG